MRRHATIALVCVLVFASFACADTLRLRDGRVLQGTVVEETRSRLVFDALISNITTRLTFRRSEIESLEAGDLPEAEPAERPARAEPTPKKRPAPTSTQADEREQYLVVPISGVFGEAVGPTGVRDALDHAARRGIEHVVFTIDSPGGQVWAADEISEVIANRDPSVRCYALIDNAISAAIWVALGCERIFIRSDGTIGGAVAYSQSNTTGAVEVDAKLNSILAAKLEGVCARNGHAPEIARAMVVYDAWLYAWEDGEGGYRFSNSLKLGATKLDDSRSVLTLTGPQVERYGLGDIFDGPVESLGDELGLESWELASAYGSAAMRRGQRSLRDRAALLDSRAKLYVEFALWAERINDTLPEDGSYNIHEGGAMTSPSIRLWRERTDACLSACQELSAVIRDLDRIAAKARRLGMDDFLDREDIGVWRTNLDAMMAQLKRNRNRSTF